MKKDDHQIVEVNIESETIKLDQFLKWAGIAGTGGEAKYLILENNVLVNGTIENQRGRKLVNNDLLEIKGHGYFKVRSSS